MIDLLKLKIDSSMSDEDKVNRTREFLQILMLKIIFDKGWFKNLAFVGGTALRILYRMRRFSEDLDFSLVEKNGYDFKTFLDNLQYELNKNNLKIEIKKERGEKAVNNFFIKFPDLLKELGFDKSKKQNLSIKVEVDTNPPVGWNLKLYPITDQFVMAINSFELESLYATKLHACFFRTYTKGRDFYDLIWYLGKKIEPNYVLLNNAIKQTEKKDLNINSENINSFLKERINNADFNLIRRDVERFLEDKNELKLLDKNLILKML